ncbi:uncharacterized protein kiaa1958 isoform X3 [Denticeps clupeoides]|uniref:uncharacterized protein kiaa1958 isoform X3 n=1 Tax=Denticeps clupeoides TaxID=299321 RepID=UPI0010A30CBC|nr:uncharacterized protein KIAA1958 homolog isoform X3 [Denticeps clupeoides]
MAPKRKYDVKFKLDAVRYAEQHSGEDPKRIRDWRRQKQELLSVPDQHRARLEGGGRKKVSEEMEARLAGWVASMRAGRRRVSRTMIRRRAREVRACAADGGGQFAASRGWLDKFLKRNGFAGRKHAAAATPDGSDPEAVRRGAIADAADEGKDLSMEDCLHTSSDNLSKLVSWAHSHGTICTLIPSLKHLLTEGSHGNLTALWGCSAGHAYHWPLMSNCTSGQKDRGGYPDADAHLPGPGSGSQGDRFLERAAKGKAHCGRTRDSCDFSNCSEASEADDNGEEYNGNLFDIVCESSATDEDSEPQRASRVPPRKRPPPPQGGSSDEGAGDPLVKKIKEETSEDYYTVAGAEAGHSSAGVSRSRPPSRSSPCRPLPHKPPSPDGDSAGVSPPGNSSPYDPPVAKPARAPLPGAQCRTAGQNGSGSAGALHLAGRPPSDDFATATAFGDLGGGANPDLGMMSAQALSADPKGDPSVPPAAYEIERLKALLQAERSKSELMGETISSLKQDKELLQQELTKKAELICDFLQDQLRPEKRRGHPSSQMEPGSSHQLISTFPDDAVQFESPALFDSFEEVELHPLDRQRTIKISKRSREGENTRVRMKNVVGVIARYMAALQEFRRSVSMKVAFDRVGVDRNTISRTAAIAELSLAAPEVFHALPPWDEKEETLARYAVRCRQAMDDNIKAKIKSMKAKGDLLPIVSK